MLWIKVITIYLMFFTYTYFTLKCHLYSRTLISHNNLVVKRWDSVGGKRNELSNLKKSSESSKKTTQPLMIRTLGSSLQVKNEQKATKVLGLVFFSFVICWAPFFSMNFMHGILPSESRELIPNELNTTFLWLGE